MGNNFLSFMRLLYEKDLFPHCSEAQFNNHEGDFSKVFFQQIFNWKKISYTFDLIKDFKIKNITKKLKVSVCDTMIKCCSSLILWKSIHGGARLHWVNQKPFCTKYKHKKEARVP
jgi:hypothetical protein